MVSLEIDVWVKRAENEKETTRLSFIRKIILKERCLRTDNSDKRHVLKKKKKEHGDRQV